MRKNKYLGCGLFRIILFAFLLFFFSLTSAQTSKGLWMVGGNLGFSQYEDRSLFNITPSGGYFFSDHFGAGTALHLSGIFSEYGNGFSTLFTPFARYYFGSGKTQPFLAVLAGINYQRYSRSDASYWEFIWYGAAGVSHFLNENVAIEGMIIYNGNIDVNFGFRIFLEPGKD